MNYGTIKSVGNGQVDVQLTGSAMVLRNVKVSAQVAWTTLAPGTRVLVDQVNGRPVVLHTVVDVPHVYTEGVQTYAATGVYGPENALLADGSVPLTGDLPVAPGVRIDGYDISVLGQTIDNLQAADSVARTGYTVMTHASHLVETIGADDTQIKIRHNLFADKEGLVVSNTAGEVEFMRVIGQAVPTVDDHGALCYLYTVTRRTSTSPANLVTGWAAATLVNGLTHKGYMTFDARANRPASPSLRFVLHTDIDAGTTEQIVRMGSLNNVLGYTGEDYGFAAGRLTTADRFLAYSYADNLLRLRGADIAGYDEAGVEVYRIWGTAEGGHIPGDHRFGPASGGHQEFFSETQRLSFFSGSREVLYFSPDGTRFRGMVWSGTQPGPQIGIGEDAGEGHIVARNAAGVEQFHVRTGEESVHIHLGNPPVEGGYAQFTQGEFLVDGTVRARAFELLGGGTITPGGQLIAQDPDSEAHGELAPRCLAGFNETGTQTALIAWGTVDAAGKTWLPGEGFLGPVDGPHFRKRGDQLGFFSGDTPKAWLDKNGDASFDGSITATAGSIAGWTISSGHLYAGSGSTRAGLQPASFPFYAGSDTPASAPFRVTPAGGLTATNATITGAITATSGSIGGWTIAAGSLYAGSGAMRAGLQPADYPFYAGSDTPSVAPFRVTNAGALTATNAAITGAIYAQTGHFAGSVYVGTADPRIRIDGTNKLIESTNFASGTSGFRINGATGDAEFNNVTLRGALAATAIQYGYVLATNGSVWVVKAAGRTLASFAAPKEGVATLDIEDPDGMTHAAAGGLWAVGDVVRMQEPLCGDFWGTVTAKADMTTYWRLTVQDAQVTGAGTFPAGATVLNYGQSGDGVVRITADAASSPYLSIATHSGTPWAGLTEKARLGNLAGISGASGYGLWTDNGYFTGTINASAGNIAGWNITADKLYWQDGIPNLGIGLSNNPGEYAIWVGDYRPAYAEFRVSHSGALWATNADITGVITANSGSIGGWTIASGHLYAGSGAGRTGLQPASFPFYAGSDTPSSAPFRVTPAGALTAANATITGVITANAGTLGGWTIDSGHLYAGAGASRAGLQPASYPFYAGSDTPSSAPFRVTPAGALTATNATITGAITANSGALGGWTIASGHLYAGAGSTRTGLQPASYPFYAGSDTPASAPFRVTPAGALTATSGTIGGWTLSGTALTAGSGATTVGLDAGGTNPAFYAGSATPAAAPFRVTNAGALTATSGAIGGWTLSSTSLTAGSGATTVGLDAGGTHPAFYAGSATPGSAPFRVTNAGALTATNVSITAGGGNVVVDTSGLTMTYGNAANKKIQWKESGTVRGAIGCWYGLANYAIYLDAPEIDLNGTLVTGKISMAGDLEHSSLGKVGFFGVTPVTRPSAYTFTNGTTDRSINCDASSVAELADLVYTMWSDLKALGLLQ